MQTILYGVFRSSVCLLRKFNLEDDGTRDNIVCTLNPGSHKVNIFAKETEFKIDAICISNNDTLPDKTPTDISPIKNPDHKMHIVSVDNNGSKIEMILEISEEKHEKRINIFAHWYLLCAFSLFSSLKYFK